MTDFDVNFSQLPEKTFEDLVSGVYVLEVEDIIKEVDPDYGTKYTMTHIVINTGRKIQFDNYKLFNAQGTAETFGQGKLRKLLEACELTNLEQINVKILKAILPGKQFKAECDVNDKGYLNIKFANIFPLSDPRIPINVTTTGIDPVQDIVTPSDFETSEVSTAVINEINDDDI